MERLLAVIHTCYFHRQMNIVLQSFPSSSYQPHDDSDDEHDFDRYKMSMT